MGVTCVTAVIHQAALQDFCVLWLLVAKISNWANDEPACRRVRLEPSDKYCPASSSAKNQYEYCFLKFALSPPLLMIH